jgi:hypothetical protein
MRVRLLVLLVCVATVLVDRSRSDGEGVPAR